MEVMGAHLSGAGLSVGVPSVFCSLGEALDFEFPPKCVCGGWGDSMPGVGFSVRLCLSLFYLVPPGPSFLRLMLRQCLGVCFSEAVVPYEGACLVSSWGCGSVTQDLPTSPS